MKRLEYYQFKADPHCQKNESVRASPSRQSPQSFRGLRKSDRGKAKKRSARTAKTYVEGRKLPISHAVELSDQLGRFLTKHDSHGSDRISLEFGGRASSKSRSYCSANRKTGFLGGMGREKKNPAFSNYLLRNGARDKARNFAGNWRLDESQSGAWKDLGCTLNSCDLWALSECWTISTKSNTFRFFPQ